jgi:hypothetical protein
MNQHKVQVRHRRSYEWRRLVILFQHGDEFIDQCRDVAVFGRLVNDVPRQIVLNPYGPWAPETRAKVNPTVPPWRLPRRMPTLARAWPTPDVGR